MISLLVYFVVIVILLSFAYYVVGQLLPPPIQKFAFYRAGLDRRHCRGLAAPGPWSEADPDCTSR